IRVSALDPAIQYAEIESALSKFDVRWNSQVTWQFTDTPIAGAGFANLLGGGAIGQNTYQAVVESGLIKPLPTGRVAGITFNTTYTDQSPTFNRVNPFYRANLRFSFEQPLLQGFGVEINQLRTAHPGSLLNQFNNNLLLAREGILITRLRYDQSRADF